MRAHNRSGRNNATFMGENGDSVTSTWPRTTAASGSLCRSGSEREDECPDLIKHTADCASRVTKAFRGHIQKLAVQHKHVHHSWPCAARPCWPRRHHRPLPSPRRRYSHREATTSANSPRRSTSGSFSTQLKRFGLLGVFAHCREALRRARLAREHDSARAAGSFAVPP